MSMHSHPSAGWRLSSLFRAFRAEPAVPAFTLSALVISADHLLAPAFTNITPALMCGFLAILISRHRSGISLLTPPDQGTSIWQLLLFFSCHWTVVAAAWVIHPGSATSVDGKIAAARYLVLLPTFFLFPVAGWSRVVGVYRAECLAALLGLLTFYPARAFAAAWPAYSQVLGDFVYRSALPLVSGLRYLPSATPTLEGPHLDVTILPACGGLQAVKLFQLLFGFLLVVDWKAVNRRRAAIGYFAGIGIFLLANALRIAVLVILGNVISTRIVVRYHLAAGWIYFTVLYAVCLIFGYRWLFRGQQGELAPMGARSYVQSTASM